MRTPSVYNGSLTREQFLFYETRITARLYVEGRNEEEIIASMLMKSIFRDRKLKTGNWIRSALKEKESSF